MLPTITLPRANTGAFAFGEQPQKRGSAEATYRRFQDRYHGDPSGFVSECFWWRKNEQPADYQLAALASIPDRRRVSVRGPHGLGKSALAAWSILWFMLTRDVLDDWKIPTTASAWRQLTKFLWPEVHKWSRRLLWKKIGREPFNERLELLSLSIKGHTGEAFALASDNSAMIEGAHAGQLFYVFDEAKVIPDDTWNSAEGAFSTGEAYWLAISTPGEPNGRFYDIQSKRPGYEDWASVHVTLQDAIRAGRISETWADQRRKQWGETSAVYQNRVEGNFAVSEEVNVIPLAWVEAANDRWYAWTEAGRPGAFTCVGVDVGRGGDKSVLALRYGSAISELRRDGQKDTMSVTGKAIGILDKQPGYAVVDVIGVGAGVVDRAREKGHRVIAFNAGAKCERKDTTGELGFVNWRAAAWWNMRELLDPANKHDIALPPDDKLTGDLTAPRWKVMSGGKIQIEAKEDVKQRIGRSTDDGDAVVQAFAPVLPNELPKDQPTQTSKWLEPDDQPAGWARRY